MALRRRKVARRTRQEAARQAETSSVSHKADEGSEDVAGCERLWRPSEPLAETVLGHSCGLLRTEEYFSLSARSGRWQGCSWRGCTRIEGGMSVLLFPFSRRTDSEPIRATQILVHMPVSCTTQIPLSFLPPNISPPLTYSPSSPSLVCTIKCRTARHSLRYRRHG